jgi:hypothetical protein
VAEEGGGGVEVGVERAVLDPQVESFHGQVSGAPQAAELGHARR